MVFTLEDFFLEFSAFFFNPLTPVPPVIARDEPWPFFHF